MLDYRLRRVSLREVNKQNRLILQAAATKGSEDLRTVMKPFRGLGTARTLEGEFTHEVSDLDFRTSSTVNDQQLDRAGHSSALP